MPEQSNNRWTRGLSNNTLATLSADKAIARDVQKEIKRQGKRHRRA